MGQRTLHRHQLRRDRTLRGGGWIEGRNPSGRRPQARDPAGIGWIAHRATEIVAMRDRPHPGGNRGCGSAARPAGRQPVAPRIARGAVQVIVAEPAVRERRRVGAPDEHRSGFPQIGDRRTVLGGDDVAKRHDAVGCGAATLIDIDFGRHRHAVQQPERRAGLSPLHRPASAAANASLSSTWTIALSAGLTAATRSRLDSDGLAARYGAVTNGLCEIGGRPAP